MIRPENDTPSEEGANYKLYHISLEVLDDLNHVGRVLDILRVAGTAPVLFRVERTHAHTFAVKVVLEGLAMRCIDNLEAKFDSIPSTQVVKVQVTSSPASDE